MFMHHTKGKSITFVYVCDHHLNFAIFDQIVQKRNMGLNFGYISRRNFQKTGYPAYTGGSVPAYRGTAYIYDSSAYTAYSVL